MKFLTVSVVDCVPGVVVVPFAPVDAPLAHPVRIMLSDASRQHTVMRGFLIMDCFLFSLDSGFVVINGYEWVTLCSCVDDPGIRNGMRTRSRSACWRANGFT
jgi:hypothetical protein